MRIVAYTQEWYLRKPECQKWIRQCAICGACGRHPSRPEKTLGFGFDKMFPEMILDERGCCEQCHAATQQL